MTTEERFYEVLAEGIIHGGGTSLYDSQEKAVAAAREAWAALMEIGTDAFPCLYDHPSGLRFIYQWDENPPVLTVMLWDDRMWRNMAHVIVPPEMQG